MNKNTSLSKDIEDLFNSFGLELAKFDFEGHSYIGYTCNLGDGLVHDPDCKCKADLHEKKE